MCCEGFVDEKHLPVRQGMGANDGVRADVFAGRLVLANERWWAAVDGVLAREELLHWVGKLVVRSVHVGE